MLTPPKPACFGARQRSDERGAKLKPSSNKPRRSCEISWVSSNFMGRRWNGSLANLETTTSLDEASPRVAPFFGQPPGGQPMTPLLYWWIDAT